MNIRALMGMGLVCVTMACGGTVDPTSDASDDAADASAPDACAPWYDPAGGVCVDTCTHQLVACAEDAGVRE